MHISRFNAEGYPDSTAAEALENVIREEIAKGRKPCVFICSPYAGDIKRNTINAKRYLKFAVDEGAIPFAPHLLYPQVLDDSDPEQRRLGLLLVWCGYVNAMNSGCLAATFRRVWLPR